MEDFGNTPWYVYVTAGYAVVALCLIAYTMYSKIASTRAVKALEDEGFLKEEA
jgi:hypothetical protein